jgi:hypothetical protein
MEALSFVNKRSELTAHKDALEAQGLEVFRTRMLCNCKSCQNRRYGLLVVSARTYVIARIIRCRGCSKGGQSNG